MRKILRAPEFYILLVLIGIAIIGIVTFRATTPLDPELHSVSTIMDPPHGDTAFGGAFFDPWTDGPSGYYKHKKQYDSLYWIKSGIDYKNNGPLGSSFSGVIGAAEDIPANRDFFDDTTDEQHLQRVVDSLDQFTILISEASGKTRDSLKKAFEDFRKNSTEHLNSGTGRRREELPKLHYITLRGYKYKDPGTRFFVDQNTYNLAYVVWDSTKPGKYDSSRYGHYERKQISVRYLSKSDDVLIPISERQFLILSPVILGGNIVMAICWILIFGFGAIYILFNISRGKPFANRNIWYLELTVELSHLP